MAKGKRSSKTSYTSKGERRNVAKKYTKLARREYLQSPERIVNQTLAYRAGKNVSKSFKEAFTRNK